MFVNYDVHMKSAFVYIHVVHVMCHVGMGIKCCAIVFYHQDEKSFSCGWSWETYSVAYRQMKYHIYDLCHTQMVVMVEMEEFYIESLHLPGFLI